MKLFYTNTSITMFNLFNIPDNAVKRLFNTPSEKFS